MRMRRASKNVAILAMVLLLVLIVACEPAPVKITPTPTPTIDEVNFRFLISDDVNAIADFQNLYVTISSIGFQRGGESGNWLEFTPDITEVDLKPLVGSNALEIWSGNLTPGEYTKAFIYVSEVSGNLSETLGGETANVKLPSGKLHISKPFVVSENAVTSFVYDITVVQAGKSGKYILKPQIAQSGADQKFSEVTPSEYKQKGKPEDKAEREREQAEEQAQEAITEAESEASRIRAKVEQGGIALAPDAFAEFDSLLSEAKSAFEAANYEEAISLAEQAEETLEDVEKLIEELKEGEEEPEEGSPENQTAGE